MEESQEKNIYFIYCQYGNESNIAKIEESNSAKNIEKINTEIKGDFLYSLYCIKLPYNFEGNYLLIKLIDKSGRKYYRNIYLKDKLKFQFGFSLEEYAPLNQKK